MIDEQPGNPGSHRPHADQGNFRDWTRRHRYYTSIVFSIFCTYFGRFIDTNRENCMFDRPQRRSGSYFLATWDSTPCPMNPSPARR
jgi:hypothetical protein